MRWLFALVAAYASIAFLALVMQTLVESRGIGYEIHWFSTMPFLAVLLAYVLQKQLRDHYGV